MFTRMNAACVGFGAMMFALIAMGNDWFQFGTFRLLSRTKLGPVLGFLAVARLCEVDCEALGLVTGF